MYEQADLELALFLDQNINLSTNVAETRVQYLQNQLNLRFNVYNSLAQEVEQARMSLEQQIPVFSVLEKSNLPSGPSTGSSNLVLILSIVIGLLDRKSTRLNSSHVANSYAVFCLKNKKCIISSCH